MELAEKDSKIVFVSADSVKAARATAFVEKYPRRYFEAGISEQSALAMAAGLAACGLKPYVITYGGFITMRACEQLRTFIAYPRLDVKLVGLNGGLIGGEREGVTHQALEDLTIVRSLPGVTLLAPAGRGGMLSRDHGARDDKRARGICEWEAAREHEVFPKDIGFEIGKIRIVKEYGKDVAFFCERLHL